ncbi:hypothetical protein [Scytonema sp. NUACC21]
MKQRSDSVTDLLIRTYKEKKKFLVKAEIAPEIYFYLLKECRSFQ